MTPQTHITEDNCAVLALPGPLGKWAGVRTEYPREKTVAALFEEAAAAYPHRVALVCGDSSLTYGELNHQANRLAHRLRTMGIGPEQLVGLCAERSLEMIAGILAILKAGGAYVPFDPAYPSERLTFMLGDAQIGVMLTQKSLLPLISAAGSFATILLDEQEPAESAVACQDPESPTSATNLAYVLYTSGSTGRPKGVMVENRAIARLVFDTNFCEFGPEQVFLQYAPISFDASTFEIWGALLHGATLVLMPPGASSLQEIADAIHRHGVTTMWLTAGLFHLFIDQRLEDLLLVRQLLAGGDTLSPLHVRRALDHLPKTTLINGYGPTEATTFTCCHSMRHGDAVPGSVPIGRPISNSFVYLLNEELQPVSTGEIGELFAGGDGVARGYLNAPELTQEKFLPDPFAKTSGARMYRTGDLAKWLPDGTLEFLGRSDDQVKILGHRIEPGEIEAALALHPAVLQAYVVTSANGAGDKRLVAYYVSGKNGSAQPSMLKEFLASKLPAYMVPSFLVPVDSFPLTPNGKVDRAALPKPGVSAASADLQPGTGMEQQVANLWKQVLDTQRIGLDDNFFDLGGDSLLIVAVHSQLQKMLQREIQVTDLFEYVTVRSLARHLSAASPVAPSFSAAQEQARKQREALAKGRVVRGSP